MFRNYIFLEVVCFIACFHYLYGQKIQYTISRLLPSVMLLLGHLMVFELIRIYDYQKNASWITIPMLFFYIILEFGIDIKKAITCLTLTIFIMSLFEFLIFAVFVIFHVTQFSDDIVAILVYSMMLLLLKVTGRWLNQLQTYCLAKNSFVIGIIGLYVLYLVFSLSVHKNKGYIELESALVIGIFGAMILALIYLWQKDKVKIDLMERNQAVEARYSESYAALMDEVRKNQHDFHNHLQAIMGLCYTAEDLEDFREKQMEYTNDIMAKNVEYKLLTSPWPCIAGFLNAKFCEASKKNIGIKYNVEISKKTDHIPEYVMIEILGILIDNAIEEVENLEQPSVYFDMSDKMGTLSERSGMNIKKYFKVSRKNT